MKEARRVAIMQPYFLPYLGYWQLIKNCDLFVVYDNIQYTKRGWINRNKFLLNGKDQVFSISLKKDSDKLFVNQRSLADDFDIEKLKRKWKAAYLKAPHFEEGMDVVDRAVSCKHRNLFEYIYHSIKILHDNLGSSSDLIISSTLSIDHSQMAQDKVLSICESLGATDYINPIGGIELYDRTAFSARGISLHFQKVDPYRYKQFGEGFVPHLSIIDMLMFIGLAETRSMLNRMSLC